MNDDPPCSLGNFALFTEAELQELELRWYEGRMLLYTEWLFVFVARHRDEILVLASDPSAPGALRAATKRLIVERGTINMGGEMKHQMREIERELWYRGEEGDYDRARIAHDRTAAHAAAWRRWRIREYLFVADQCVNRVFARLLAPDTEGPKLRPVEISPVRP